MTKHETSAIDRIPITRSVSYAVRDAPELPAHGATIPGTTLAPTQITFTYQAAPDSQLGRIQARVKGFWMRDGGRVNPGQPMAQHYFDGLTDWPEWLAEEARLHDPEAAVSVPSPAPRADDAFVPPAAEGLPPAALDSATEGANALDAWARSPYGRNFLAHALVQLARDGWLRAEPGKPADRAALRQRIARALEREDALHWGYDHGFADRYGVDSETDAFVDAVLAVLPEPADRAAVLREVGWTECSPEWLAAHPGECGTAPRVPGAPDVSHWHPQQPVGPCVAGEQQNETPEAEAPVVAYRPRDSHSLYCTAHAGELFGLSYEPVTAEDLPDGGICTYPECGVDVLISQDGAQS